MNTTIRIAETTTGKLAIRFPYYPPMVKAIKEVFNGRWQPETKTWYCDLRDRSRVEETLRKYFGTAGESVTMCAIRVKLDECAEQQTVYVCGRTVAHRPSHRESVRLGDGVVLESGGFPSKSGSVKYPTLGCFKNTVVLVRDVPLSLAEQWSAKDSDITIEK